jgi:20S proteasome alpha/beta subunit
MNETPAYVFRNIKRPLPISRKANAMTIAIGALYSDGVIVAADSKVVFSDGSTDSANKLFLALSPERAMMAIADAAEDAHAAKMVAGAISSAFVDAHREGKKPDALLSEAMGTWYRSYGYSQVPVLEFLVGKVIVDKWVGLYYLQPPSTILWQAPFAIGRGARPVEPLLGLLSNGKNALKPQLMLLAYLMYLAKKEEGSACGGHTSVLVITKGGSWTFVEEMEAAEDLASDIHSSVQQYIREAVGASTMFPSAPFTDLQKALLDKAGKLDFPSLKNLDMNVWKGKLRKQPKQPKQLAAQTSESEP